MRNERELETHTSNLVFEFSFAAPCSLLQRLDVSSLVLGVREILAAEALTAEGVAEEPREGPPRQLTRAE